MRRVVAVDCGTNTIKLLVTDLDSEAGTAHDLLRETRMVRLGQGVDRTGRLSDEAVARAFAALEEYAAILAPLGPESIRFCATSAVRDSSNAEEFAAGVEQRLGVRPEVVTGLAEARLSFSGATRDLGERWPRPVLVADIGGGSTEVIVGLGPDEVLAEHSLDIGSVRLTERHLHSDPPTRSEIDAAVTDIDEALDTLTGFGVDLGAAASFVAVSGTGLTLTAAALDHPGLDRALVHHASASRVEIDAAAERLLAMTVARRRALPYMPAGRADVIGGGALILTRLMARLPVDRVTASIADILDGIAWSQTAPPGM